MTHTSTPKKNEWVDLGTMPIVAETRNPLLLHVSKIQTILKSQLSNILNGKNVDLDAAILKELQYVYNEGYSNGIRHMDLMHHKTDQ